MKCAIITTTTHNSVEKNETKTKETITEYHRFVDAQRDMLKNASQLVEMGFILEEIKTDGYSAYRPYPMNGEYITMRAKIAI